MRKTGRRLPQPTSSFIGREDEVTTVCDILLRPDTRLLTLVGPPGVGKTRLALAVAESIKDRFDDGARFVDLSAIRDPALVPAAIAQALGLREFGAPHTGTLADYLQDWDVVFVLDNFEQVVEAAGAIADVLTACPDVKVMATSREPLHIAGEQQFPVPPLALAARGAEGASEITRSAAVELFADRARAVRPDFVVSDANAGIVADICRRLDGLPLAIEMAATQIKFLNPEALLKSLSSRLASLSSQARTLPERHRTLRSCIAWSYDLLAPQEQRVFRRLSVFRGGCTLEAANAVCIDDQTADAALATALVDKSLVQIESQPDGSPRLSMLEGIREFAREQLEAHGESEHAQNQHVKYFLNLAERAEPQVRARDQDLWVSRLETDHDNFRGAMQWAIDGGDLEAAAGIGWALHWFWYLYGHNREGRDWLRRVLSSPMELSSLARARVLAAAGFLSWSRGGYEEARGWLTEAVASLRLADDPASLARALHYLGHELQVRRESAASLAAFEESISIFRAIEDEWGVAWSENCSGYPLAQKGNYDRAIARMEHAHADYLRLGDRRLIGYGLGDLGTVLAAKGDLPRAAASYERSVAMLRETGASVRLVWSLAGLALIALRREDYVAALHFGKETLILSRDLGAGEEVAHAITTLAIVAASQRQVERSAHLLGAADVLLRGLGLDPSSSYGPHIQRNIEHIRTTLGEETFYAHFRAGRTERVEDMIEEALSVERAQPAEARSRGAGPLSPRERDVATLVARGLSNREIGRTLLIGHRTVATHVESILNKLGVDKRAQIAAWAVSQGLTTPAS